MLFIVKLFALSGSVLKDINIFHQKINCETTKLLSYDSFCINSAFGSPCLLGIFTIINHWVLHNLYKFLYLNNTSINSSFIEMSYLNPLCVLLPCANVTSDTNTCELHGVSRSTRLTVSRCFDHSDSIGGLVHASY